MTYMKCQISVRPFRSKWLLVVLLVGVGLLALLRFGPGETSSLASL